MRKLFSFALVLGFVAFMATANAQESVAGGFEMNGSIVTGMGYQHHNNDASTYATNDGDRTYFSGVLGAYLPLVAVPAVSSDYFTFFLDAVELDVTKSFGENIKLRADVDVLRGTALTTATAATNAAAMASAVSLEQAYATANIPVGNGIEFLLGRFNAPMGFESADVASNYLISKSALGAGLRPVNMTGAKLYYAFTDLIDLHFYVVNTLYRDSAIVTRDIPSVGARLGFNWGEDDAMNTIGVSPMFGPETRISNKHYTFGGDLDFNVWLTEAFAIGGEGLFTRNNNFGGTSNTEYMSGLLNLHYAFTDVWDGTLQFVLAKQYDPGADAAGVTNLTGFTQTIYQAALGGGYAIADGAKLKLEGRFDIVNPTGASNTEYIYGGAMAFNYDF